jgi:hypothetical protein
MQQLRFVVVAKYAITSFSSITQQKSMAQITAPCPNKRKPYSQNRKLAITVLI